MNWLQKSFLTTASFFILNQSIAQTFKYEASFGLFNTKLGEVEYNSNNHHLSININKFVNIHFTYHMPNDSTYIEINNNGKLIEKFEYAKQDSFWYLQDYTALKGEPRLDKIALEKTRFNKKTLTPIETLEKLLKNNVSDSNQVIIFGVPYNIIIEDKKINAQNAEYKGNIRPYKQNKTDKFLLEDALTIHSKKEENRFIPHIVNAKTKVLQIINLSIKARLKK